MGSSSNESFVWSDASYSSCSSTIKNEIVQHNMKENDDDSDYGNTYKKKLHKKLFVEIKPTNEPDHVSNYKKEKKSKHKMIDDNTEDTPKNKKIKLEPESDKDTSKKKKKKKSDTLQAVEDMSQDYSNYNVTVKKEKELESSLLQSKKEKRNTKSISLNKYENIVDPLETTIISNDEKYAKKKKKINASALHSESIDDTLQNYSNVNITVKEEQELVSTPAKTKKQRKNTQSDISMSSNHEVEYNFINNNNSNIELNETNCNEKNDESYSKKKKRNKVDVLQQNDGSNDKISKRNMSQNHSNLNIKKEQEVLPPSPKSKKQRRNTQLDTNTSLNCNVEDINIKKNYSNTDFSETICTVSNDGSYKKKNKRKQHSKYDDDHTSTEDKGTEDTASYSQQYEIDHLKERKKVSVMNEKSRHEVEIKNVHHSSNNSDNTEISDGDNGDNHKLISQRNSILNTSKVLEKSNRRVSRISDRLQFEDAETSQMDISIINQLDNTNSHTLKKFLKNNQNLSQIPIKEQSEEAFSANEEVWVIKCPQNIDVNSFLGAKIKLDRKSKIKVDNQTYVGSINSESASIAVMTSEHNNYVIKKIPLSGTLHLRKKIPKVHIPDDNIILDNQTDFVPLPDTKNRHPLFGSNYKKAIKVPSAVAQKLNESSVCETYKIKKKKHKREKKEPNEHIDEIKELIHEDDNNSSSKKKSRKRKHETDGESYSTKRVKQAEDSTAVWESEQAIEENLFNF